MTRLLAFLLAALVSAAAHSEPVDTPLYTPVSWECKLPEPSTYACAQEAMNALRSHYWRPHYSDTLLAIVDVAEKFSYRGEHPLSSCDLADALVVLTWWESTWEPGTRGSRGEGGLTQVIPCERAGGYSDRCANGYNGYQTRPSRKWLAADPRNGLQWAAGYLQDRGVTYHSIRSYNGRGIHARAYARRFFASLERIHDWRETPRSLPPLPRSVRTKNSPWLVERPDEPSGTW